MTLPSFGQLALGLTLVLPLILYHRLTADPKPAARLASALPGDKDEKTMMQPERTDLDPPKDDPFTQEQLTAYDGSDASKPIYVSIKGTVIRLTKLPDRTTTPSLVTPLSLSRSGAFILIRVYLYRNGFRCVTEARNVRAWRVIRSIGRQGRIARTWIVEPQARGRSGGLEHPRREGAQNSRRLAYFLYVRVLL